MAIPAIALMIGMSTASQACVWWFHHPYIYAKGHDGSTIVTKPKTSQT